MMGTYSLQDKLLAERTSFYNKIQGDTGPSAFQLQTTMLKSSKI